MLSAAKYFRTNNRQVKGKMQISGTRLSVTLKAFILIIFTLVAFLSSVQAEQITAEQTTAEKLETLKKDVLSINRDLFILEEDLLFPASTQIAVYLSLDTGLFFALDNVKLKIDDKDITHHLYTRNDVDALKRGAIQKLFVGNLSSGNHQIVAVVIGMGPHNREYRKAVAFEFNKSSEAKALEVQLRDDTDKKQLRLNVVEW